jgi:hypothetical protein
MGSLDPYASNSGPVSLSIIRGRGDVVTRFTLLLSADAYAMQLCKQGLMLPIGGLDFLVEHDFIGKPAATFPDYALLHQDV